jgi:hypothetical protein
LGKRDKNFKKFDIDYLMYLYKKQNGLCRYTGIPMTHIRGSGYVQTNISIDRINGSKGYKKRNIQLVCRWANAAKNSLNPNDFIGFCHKVYNKNPNIYK